MADPEFYKQESTPIIQAKERLEALEGEIMEAYARWEALEAVGQWAAGSSLPYTGLRSCLRSKSNPWKHSGSPKSIPGWKRLPARKNSLVPQRKKRREQKRDGGSRLGWWKLISFNAENSHRICSIEICVNQRHLRIEVFIGNNFQQHSVDTCTYHLPTFSSPQGYPIGYQQNKCYYQFKNIFFIFFAFYAWKVTYWGCKYKYSDTRRVAG